MLYWPGCKSVSPQYAAAGNSKVPFSTSCALACVVVKPRANAVSAKVIVKCFRAFIVILLFEFGSGQPLIALIL
jgi:hypothetical protein